MIYYSTNYSTTHFFQLTQKGLSDQAGPVINWPPDLQIRIRKKSIRIRNTVFTA